jgi:putative membrane protein
LCLSLVAAGCDKSGSGGSDATTGGPAAVADAGVTPGETVPPAAPGARPGAMDPATFVATAASSDMYEIRSSELALKQATMPRLQQFAGQMVSEHKATTAQLTKAVADAGGNLAMPGEMMPRHAEMLRELEGASPADFDRLYLEQQRRAHAEALDLHRLMASQGNGPAPLVRFASETAPKVEMHYKMLTDMAPGTTDEGGRVSEASAPRTGGN